MSVDNKFKSAGGFRLNPLDLARGEWQIDGVPVTVSAAQINTLSGTGSSPVTFIYVDGIDGNDSVGTGQIGNPFKTISAAYASITDNSITKPYLIICDPAQYTITGDLVLRPWINIQGNGAQLTITGQITRHPTYTNAGDFVKIYDFIDVDIQGDVNLDFTGCLGTCILEFSGLRIKTNSTWNIYGDTSQGLILVLTDVFGTSNQIDCNFRNLYGDVGEGALGNFTYDNTSSTNQFTFSLKECTELGNVLIRSSSNQNFSFILKDNIFIGSVTIRSTSTGQPICVYSSNAQLGSTITVDGANAFFTSDVINQNPTLINGATSNNIIYTSISDTLLANYTPTNYTPTNTSVKGHLSGIDAALTNILGFIRKIVIVTGGNYLVQDDDDGALLVCTDNVTRNILFPINDSKRNGFAVYVLKQNIGDVNLTVQPPGVITGPTQITNQGAALISAKVGDVQWDTIASEIVPNASFTADTIHANAVVSAVVSGLTTPLVTDSTKAANVSYVNSRTQTTIVAPVGPLTMAPNTTYINTVGSPNIYNLPSSGVNVGDVFEIIGHLNSWKIQQQSGQTIYVDNLQTTTGVGGSIESSAAWQSIKLICITANTEFRAFPHSGSPTIV